VGCQQIAPRSDRDRLPPSDTRIKTKSLGCGNGLSCKRLGGRHSGQRVRQVASSFGQKFEAKSSLKVGRDGGFIVTRVALIMPWVIAAAALAAAHPARAQANLDAGKSAAQIFADTCNACHRSPREIRPTSAAFLREHYTTGAREAAAMAAYLASVG